MLRPYTKITIYQQATSDFPDRTGVLYLDFCHSWEADEGWENMTDTAKIVFPKNVIVKDRAGVPFNLYGTNKSMGGGQKNVLFLRGDHVSITGGYYYTDAKSGQLRQTEHLIFSGYISKVHSKIPIEIECEDNMWLLKQTPAPNKFWPSKQYDMIGIITELVALAKDQYNIPLTVGKQAKITLDFSLGGFFTKNESVAQVLARIKKDYRLNSFFRGNELRVGFPIYLREDANTANHFVFQQNIISDNLEYKRKDDVVLSAVVRSQYTEETGAITKDGKPKTKKERLEILVYQDPTKPNGFWYKEKVKGETLPPAEQGERYDFPVFDVTDTHKMYLLGAAKLQQYYYTGFKGSFVTFGLPYVKWGDIITLTDNLYPDRNGRYLVKKVGYKGGVDGFRQEIHLDFMYVKADNEADLPAPTTQLLL